MNSAASPHNVPAHPLHKIPLDGTWMIATDIDNAGKEKGWFKSPAPPDAVAIDVPSSLQHAFPEYHGVVWYWREFTLEDEHPGRTLIRFDAVEYLAEVWVNGHSVGSHRGGQTPFTVDITDALRTGRNALVVRVLNVTDTEIDGLVRSHIAHGLHGLSPTLPNWGGIWQSVTLERVPSVYITDVFAETDWRAGTVTARVTITNSTQTPCAGTCAVTVFEDRSGRSIVTESIDIEAPAGTSTHSKTLAIPSFHSWSPQDPFLYRLETRLKSHDSCDRKAVRFGMREFTYEDGYFRLNGKRFFPRCTHLCAFYPGGYAPWDKDMLHREILLAKEGGFNMLRFLGTAAIPPELDMADEMGLLIYEEHAASWQIADAPETVEEHKREMMEVIKRDRNHPSVAMWGVLNEWMIFYPDGPIAESAINILPAIRELDPTRFVVLDSGRYNYARWHKDMFLTRPGVGNYALPRSTEWIDEIADVHTYGEYPTSEKFRNLMRYTPVEDRKVFQTEFGHNHMDDVVSYVCMYHQLGIPEHNDEFVVWKELQKRVLRDWNALNMEEVFPTIRHLWDADKTAHCYKMRHNWHLIQANEKQIATSYTGFVGAEGVGDHFRRPKPALKTIREMQQPLIWCLFIEPVSLYKGGTLAVEALLRNEDVLPSGSYKAELVIHGPKGIAFHKEGDAVIPPPAPGKSETELVVHPVFKETIQMDFPPGDYEVHVRLLEGGDARAALPVYLGDEQNLPTIQCTISAMGLTDEHISWLSKHGVKVVPFDEKEKDVPLILHRLWIDPEAHEKVKQALAFAEAGGTVYFLEVTGSDYPLDMNKDVSGPMRPPALSEEWQKQQQDLLQTLPGMEKADLVWDSRNWYTGTTHYIRPHAFFEGLPVRCVMEDKPVYLTAYPMHSVAGYKDWTEITGAFSTGSLPAGGTEYEGLPPYFGYWHATDFAHRAHGKGKLVYCAYQLFEHLGVDPAADRMLLNLLRAPI